MNVEPDYYLPIIPMVLVNGSSGIGTGWSSDIPNYNPKDIVANIKRMLSNPKQQPLPMHPWYKRFTGSIHPSDPNRYIVYGRIERVDDLTIRISELPVQVWTSNYKEILQTMLDDGEIKRIAEHYTDTTVSFTVTMTEEQMTKAERVGLYSKFKLISTLLTSNMVLFNAQGQLKKYDTVLEILQEFFTIRLQGYHRRKAHLLHKLTEQCDVLKNKVKFILAVRSKQFDINADDAPMLKQLIKDGYTRYPKQKKAIVAGEVDDSNDSNDSNNSASDDDDNTDNNGNSNNTANTIPKLSDYHYLLSMPINTIGYKLAKSLQTQYDAKQTELKKLSDTTPEDMWNQDLDTFLVAYEKHLETELLYEQMEFNKPKKGTKDKGGKQTKIQGNKPVKTIAKTNNKSKSILDDIKKGKFIEPPKVEFKSSTTTKQEKKQDRDLNIEPNLDLDLNIDLDLDMKINENNINTKPKPSSNPKIVTKRKQNTDTVLYAEDDSESNSSSSSSSNSSSDSESSSESISSDEESDDHDYIVVD